jgi:hypothetical protein
VLLGEAGVAANVRDQEGPNGWVGRDRQRSSSVRAANLDLKRPTSQAEPVKWTGESEHPLKKRRGGRHVRGSDPVTLQD